MTQDEIIEMAKEAGLSFYEFVWTSPTKENLYPEGVSQEALERFAKLVAAKEREACLKACERSHFSIFAAKEIRARGQE